MPYPTVAHPDAIAWVTRWRQQEEASVLPAPPQVTIKPEGDARDWDEIATALVAELETLLKDYVQGGGRDVAMAYEAEASVLVHQRLPEHPALGNPEFWTWLAVVHGAELVVQRYTINRKSGAPKVPGTDNFSSRSSPENLFFRLWFRGDMGYCKQLEDAYFYARCGDIDIWRSHLFRQGYADARPFAHALQSFQYPEGPGDTPRLGIDAIRALVKRLRPPARTFSLSSWIERAQWSSLRTSTGRCSPKRAPEAMKPSFSTTRHSIVRVERLGERLLESRVANYADPELDGESAWWQSILRGARIEGPEKTRKLNVIDAFCGAGGFALGLRFAADVMGTDIRFSAIVDTDAGALRVHATNFGAQTVLHESVRNLVDYQLRGADDNIRFAYSPEIVTPKLARLQPTDILIAGPPCQGHSNLNNHSRRRDPRNDHFVTAVAFGIALGARAILIENVPTVQNAHGDVVRVAETLLRSAGYQVSVAVLRAERLGSAQARARFFMHAVAPDSITDDAVDWLRHFAAAREASPQPVTWAIGDLVDRKPDSIFDSAPEPSETNRRRIAWLVENDAHDLPLKERPDCHRNGTRYTAVYGRMYRERPAPTITTGFGAAGQGRFIHPDRPRLITPHEAARIQGFPDWFDFAPNHLPYMRKSLAKWIGDAVPSILGFTAGLAALRRLQAAAPECAVAG